jgi:hypothetical protein
VPTQIAKEQTDKNQRANQAMFFGTQGIVVALSNALNEPVWINVSKIDYENHPEFGPHVITYIIVAICTLALVAAFFMPKHLQNIGKKQS